VSVVVNEMEVVPTQRADTPQQPAQEPAAGPSAPSPDLDRQIERVIELRRARLARLEAD
jgi:hypothetical protein